MNAPASVPSPYCASATPWRVESFPSGTVVVTRGSVTQAYFYVWASGGITDTQRYLMATELCEWLNGGQRAPWMDTLFRDGAEQVVTDLGNIISAVGPWHDPAGTLDWTLQEGDDRILRGLLIEGLVNNKRPD